MAKEEKVTIKIEPLTKKDKIEPIEIKSRSNFSIDEWARAAAAVGGRANGKTSMFGKAVNDAMARMAAEAKEKEIKAKMAEKWIWVEGYKGTDQNMWCRGTQFELNKMYSAEEGTGVTLCESGFHLCLNLKDVFGYYSVGEGNRFFKVRALVREEDVKAYGKPRDMYSIFANNKLTSMSIEFISELTPDEILKAYNLDISNWSEAAKLEALKTKPAEVEARINAEELVVLGYSLPFANYVAKKGAVEIAKAVANQPGLSMDMKALFILKEIYD